MNLPQLPVSTGNASTQFYLCEETEWLSHTSLTAKSPSVDPRAHWESEAPCFLSLVVNESTDADKQPNNWNEREKHWTQAQISPSIDSHQLSVAN